MILYLGNILSHLGKSVSVIEILGPRLAGLDQVVMASRKANKILRLLDMLMHVMKYRKSRILLIDCYSSTAFWYVVLISRLAIWLRIPYVPILHGGDLPARLKSSPRLSRFVFSNSQVNVSPSQYLKEHFTNAGFKTTFIPNFIELKEYHFMERKKIRPKLFWVRAFHKIYNPILTVDIVKLLMKKYPDVSLCMVGTDKDGSMNEVRMKAKREGIGDRLEITGFLAKEEWKQKSEEYDLFINTTNFDNMPVSVIEAMALGLPVVSTNAGGLPYLIHHEKNGLIVSKGNAQEFADAIDKLISQPAVANNLSRNARLMVEEFDWNVVKNQWKEVVMPYENVKS